MNRTHRKAHGLTWLVLLPLLMAIIYLAQIGQLAAPAVVDDPPRASAAGELP